MTATSRKLPYKMQRQDQDGVFPAQPSAMATPPPAAAGEASDAEPQGYEKLMEDAMLDVHARRLAQMRAEYLVKRQKLKQEEKAEITNYRRTSNKLISDRVAAVQTPPPGESDAHLQELLEEERLQQDRARAVRKRLAVLRAKGQGSHGVGLHTQSSGGEPAETKEGGTSHALQAYPPLGEDEEALCSDTEGSEDEMESMEEEALSDLFSDTEDLTAEEMEALMYGLQRRTLLRQVYFDAEKGWVDADGRALLAEDLERLHLDA